MNSHGLKVYDQPLSLLRRAAEQARPGNERLPGALKRPGQQPRMLERAER